MGSLASDSESRFSARYNSIEFAQHDSVLESEPPDFTDSEVDSLESAYFEINSSSRPFNYDNSMSGFQIQDDEAEKREYSPLRTMNKKKKNQVFLERYVEEGEVDDLTRTKSLTDEDLDELKGCFDLGFGFSYEEIPELCNTLPALELCYSMSQKFLEDKHKPSVSSSPDSSPVSATSMQSCSPASNPIANWKISSPGCNHTSIPSVSSSPDSSPVSATSMQSCSPASNPIANWKISSPGDHPEDVKARLKYWAQAVACTVRLCS